MPVRLDADQLPPALRGFVPLAERWGIPDDGYRDDAVVDASDTDLEELVRSFENLVTDELFNWPAAPRADIHSPEYGAPQIGRQAA